MTVQKANIQFKNFKIIESHIVFKEPGQYKLEINFDPKGVILKNLNQFHFELNVDIKDANNKFNIVLKSISIFEYPENADLEEYKNSLFIVNVPAIMFPYLRAYISSLTALSGMPTLTLPTLNLSNIGKTLKSNIKEIE